MTSSTPPAAGVPPARVAALARGANVSRWFRYPAEQSERHFRGFITDADLDLLVALGFSSVRLAVDPSHLRGEAPAPAPAPAVLPASAGQSTSTRANPPPPIFDPRRLAHLDEAIARLVARGLVVVLDYHDESRSIESGPAEVETFATTWSALAAHLNHTDPDAVLLEVLNEPVFDASPESWFPIQRQLIDTIRAAAPRHTLVTGGPNWSSLDGLLRGRPVQDANVVYTFHFYEPYEFTHQGAPWANDPPRGLSGVPYPASPAQERRTRERIQSAADWAARHRVPVWAGEFGAYPPAAPRPDRLRWLHDVRTACESHGIGWAVWSYDESLGLDRRIDTAGRITIDWDSAHALGLRAPRGPAATA